jgi:hypothetical protein
LNLAVYLCVSVQERAHPPKYRRLEQYFLIDYLQMKDCYVLLASGFALEAGALFEEAGLDLLEELTAARNQSVAVVGLQRDSPRLGGTFVVSFPSIAAECSRSPASCERLTALLFCCALPFFALFFFTGDSPVTDRARRMSMRAFLFDGTKIL